MRWLYLNTEKFYRKFVFSDSHKNRKIGQLSSHSPYGDSWLELSDSCPSGAALWLARAPTAPLLTWVTCLACKFWDWPLLGYWIQFIPLLMFPLLPTFMAAVLKNLQFPMIPCFYARYPVLSAWKTKNTSTLAEVDFNDVFKHGRILPGQMAHHLLGSLTLLIQKKRRGLATIAKGRIFLLYTCCFLTSRGSAIIVTPLASPSFTLSPQGKSALW